AFQWLDPIDGNYDDARRAAAQRVFGELPEIQPSDFAVLLDARSDDAAMAFRCEVGVVAANEIPPRLSRQQGRMRQGRDEVPATIWPVSSLPEVALFCDTDWMAEGDAPESVQEFLNVWGSVRVSAERVVSELFERLRPSTDDHDTSS